MTKSEARSTQEGFQQLVRPNTLSEAGIAFVSSPRQKFEGFWLVNLIHELQVYAG
jgi:hypothetical protein